MTVYDDKATLPRESSTQCNYSDIFMSHADICRSNGPENKLTYHAHVLISLYGEYTGTYWYDWYLDSLASFPGFSRTRTCVHWESLVSFSSCDHDIIKIWLVFRTEKPRFSHCSTNYAFNQLCVQCSVCMIFVPDNRRSVVSCPLSLLFFESSGMPMHN